MELSASCHEDFTIEETGLFIDPDLPYLGASPDSIVSCTCCGKGVVEVKCPFCFKDGLPTEDDQSFCMTKQDDVWALKKNHPYYYQIQLQMFVCKTSYADFVVWTEKECIVKRVTIDQPFLKSHCASSKTFLVYGVLPEIIGKFYSRKPAICTATDPHEKEAQSSSVQGDDDDDAAKLWCYCNEPSFGDMVMCDNSNCTIKWFHFDCLRIRCPPKGKWYCPHCRKLPNAKGRRKH